MPLKFLLVLECFDDSINLTTQLLSIYYYQARERQRREEQEILEREAAEAERKRKEDEEAQARAVQEAAEKEAALARRRQEKAMALGAEPEKGPDVTRVCSMLFCPSSTTFIQFFIITTFIQFFIIVAGSYKISNWRAQRKEIPQFCHHYLPI
jgi:ATPase subunit of ABC transporter with duplicated ATPase domains